MMMPVGITVGHITLCCQLQLFMLTSRVRESLRITVGAHHPVLSVAALCVDLQGKRNVEGHSRRASIDVNSDVFLCLSKEYWDN